MPSGAHTLKISKNKEEKNREPVLAKRPECSNVTLLHCIDNLPRYQFAREHQERDEISSERDRRTKRGTRNMQSRRKGRGTEARNINKSQEMLEPRARVELATCRLRIGCSTTELPRPVIIKDLLPCQIYFRASAIKLSSLAS